MKARHLHTSFLILVPQTTPQAAESGKTAVSSKNGTYPTSGAAWPSLITRLLWSTELVSQDCKREHPLPALVSYYHLQASRVMALAHHKQGNWGLEREKSWRKPTPGFPSSTQLNTEWLLPKKSSVPALLLGESCSSALTVAVVAEVHPGYPCGFCPLNIRGGGLWLGKSKRPAEVIF